MADEPVLDQSNPYQISVPDTGKEFSYAKGVQYCFVVFLLSVVAVGLFLIVGETGTAINVKAHLECKHNLDEFYSVLQEHGTEGWTPGQQEERWTALRFDPCVNGKKFYGCYIVTPKINTIELVHSADSLPVVLACDRPGNHPILKANGLREKKNGVIQEHASILLSNGRVLWWHGNEDDYRKWTSQFAEGHGREYPPGMDFVFDNGEIGFIQQQ